MLSIEHQVQLIIWPLSINNLDHIGQRDAEYIFIFDGFADLLKRKTYKTLFRTCFWDLFAFTGWRETEWASEACCHSATWPQILWKKLCEWITFVKTKFWTIFQLLKFPETYVDSLFIQSHMEWPDWHRSRVLLHPRKHYCELYRWRYVGIVGRMGLQKVWSQQQREVSDGTPQGVQHIRSMLRNPVGEDLLQAAITAHQAQDWVLHRGRHVQEAQEVWKLFEPLRSAVISHKTQVKGRHDAECFVWNKLIVMDKGNNRAPLKHDQCTKTTALSPWKTIITWKKQIKTADKVSLASAD